MWWFLILLGVLIALAGIAVIAFGVTIFISSFGNTLITTGAVAASGGFVITAMGLVLRQLERLTQQIEQRVEAEAAALPPQRPRLDARPQPAAVEYAPPVRRDTPPLLAEEDLVSEPEPEPEAPIHEPAAPRRRAPPLGASSVPRADLAEDNSEEEPPAHLDPMVEARRQRLERARLEEAPRPARPRAPLEVPPRPATRGAAMPPPAPAPRRSVAPEVVEPRVLKSGIVGGMAYTLYSDGSIQAELPDGVVRFGSLQELRDHVAKSQGR